MSLIEVDILEIVKNTITNNLDVPIEDIHLETDFQNDLDADSLDIVELIMELEVEFDIEINDDELDKLRTVEDVVEYIKNNI